MSKVGGRKPELSKIIVQKRTEKWACKVEKRTRKLKEKRREIRQQPAQKLIKKKEEHEREKLKERPKSSIN